MYVPQHQLKNIKRLISQNKALVIYGPRRCGKTTLIKRFLDDVEEKYLFVSGDDITTQTYLSSQSISKLSDFVGQNKLLVVDEAQMRDDIGMLWKNYIIMEKIKIQEYFQIFSNNYFWRTYDRKEIDMVEERDGKLFGYEIKWKKGRSKPPNDWLKTYKNATYEVISHDNYLDFIIPEKSK